MKALTRTAVAVLLVLFVAATLRPAEAICQSPRLFSSGYSYIYTPGCGSSGCGTLNTSMSDDAVGVFWAIGAGDPMVDRGIDNGRLPFLGGWAGGEPGYPTYFFGHWALHGIDFCIDAAPANHKCMAVLLMDNDADTGAGAFALLTKRPDELGNYNFNQGGPVDLIRIPRPTIISAVDIVNNMVMDVALTGVTLGDIDPGLFLDLHCPQPSAGAVPDLIRGYQVFVQEVAITEPPSLPVDNDVDSWSPAGPVTPLGQPSNVTLTCDGDPAVAKYLTTGLVFDSGYRTVWLSGLSTRIECGANLADPEDIFQRKPRNRELPRSRSRGR